MALKNNFFFSALQFLGIANTLVKPHEFCKYDPDIFGCVTDDPLFSNRLLTESLYATLIEEQKPLIEEIKKDEALKIPPSFDYWDRHISISNEEREKLTMARPQTVR